MLKVFACLSFACTTQHMRSKLDPRSRKCIFLGYKIGTKGYILFDLKTREIFVSRHVIFHEQVFPFMPSLIHLTLSPAHQQHCAIFPLFLHLTLLTSLPYHHLTHHNMIYLLFTHLKNLFSLSQGTQPKLENFPLTCRIIILISLPLLHLNHLLTKVNCQFNIPYLLFYHITLFP